MRGDRPRPGFWWSGIILNGTVRFAIENYVGRGMAAKAETPEETLGCDQLLRIHSAKKGFVNR